MLDQPVGEAAGRLLAEQLRQRAGRVRDRLHQRHRTPVRRPMCSPRMATCTTGTAADG
ncbi:hypothetical protein NC658_21325 [Streptomyces griseoincarnatus]|uniref:Uncharacterized protein n=1 Tax=Streptomyces griseoincarnatus TaxID=29305 RepID=A0ABT0VWP7_STRGI|nr:MULTISPECIES: hypothetical protein [Streptomyces]MCM2515775.1 hypothetical protein [Streptomyces griseoincarnatus]